MNGLKKIKNIPICMCERCDHIYIDDGKGGKSACPNCNGRPFLLRKDDKRHSLRAIEFCFPELFSENK